MRITWRDRFPKSMLTDAEKVSETTKKLRDVRNSSSTFMSSLYHGNTIDCDEVYPNIFLGDGYTAKNLPFLKEIGITHVVNTAMGTSFSMVDTNKEFYKKRDLHFLGFSMADISTANISEYFESVANFIENALSSFGKVYIHCFMGISRSATCVIAFLMLKRGMTAEEAFKTCKHKRFICPNDGFIIQLAELDVKLQERRELTEAPVSEESKKKLCEMS